MMHVFQIILSFGKFLRYFYFCLLHAFFSTIDIYRRIPLLYVYKAVYDVWSCGLYLTMGRAGSMIQCSTETHSFVVACSHSTPRPWLLFCVLKRAMTRRRWSTSTTYADEYGVQRQQRRV